jgi:hypothetical protein
VNISNLIVQVFEFLELPSSDSATMLTLRDAYYPDGQFVLAIQMRIFVFIIAVEQVTDNEHSSVPSLYCHAPALRAVVPVVLGH